MTQKSTTGPRALFVIGVMALSALFQLMTHRPEMFGRLCVFLAVFTVFEKAISYYTKGWHLFVLDFCYWVNLSCALIPLLIPEGELSRMAHAALFIHANGPVALAVPIWNQCLTFHDPERILSVGVHVWPMLVTYATAWYPFDETSASFAGKFDLSTDLVLVLVTYLGWQLAYFMITNVLLANYMKRNKGYASSFRWIASDHDNAINALIVSLARRMRVFSEKERMSPDDIRSELMFMLIQLIYTIVTCSIAALVAIGGYKAHLAMILFTMASSLWNASAVYLEGSDSDMRQPEIDNANGVNAKED
eukprot:jgi/Bigna1/77960/fgenesh1_pg.51_\